MKTVGAAWIHEYHWEKMWRQEFNPVDQFKGDKQEGGSSGALIVHTHEYGKRSLPIEVWT